MLYTPLYVRYLTFSSTLRHLSIFFMFSNILSVTNVVSSPKASIHEHTERFTTNQQPTLLYWICNILMLNPFQIQIISLYWTKPKKASDNVFSYIIKHTHSFMCIYKTQQYQFGVQIWKKITTSMSTKHGNELNVHVWIQIWSNPCIDWRMELQPDWPVSTMWSSAPNVLNSSLNHSPALREVRLSRDSMARFPVCKKIYQNFHPSSWKDPKNMSYTHT